EIRGVLLPLLELGGLAGEKRVDERLVLVPVQRAVDVVGDAAARPGLVVARLEPRLLHVDRLAMDDRRDGVEEGEGVLAGQRADRRRERRRGERPGGDD